MLREEAQDLSGSGHALWAHSKIPRPSVHQLCFFPCLHRAEQATEGFDERASKFKEVLPLRVVEMPGFDR